MKHVIINAVTQTFGFDGKEIFLNCRKRHLVEARQITFYYLKKYKDWNLYKIAELFELNYATVRHGYFEYQNKLDVYKSEKANLEKFRMNIEQRGNLDRTLLEEFLSKNDEYLSPEIKEYLIVKL